MDVGFALAPKHWNPRRGLNSENRVRKGHPNSEELNRQLTLLHLQAYYASVAFPLCSAFRIRAYLRAHRDEPLDVLQQKAEATEEIEKMLTALLEQQQQLLRFNHSPLQVEALRADLADVLAAHTSHRNYSNPNNAGVPAPNKKRRARFHRF
jgi:hypothetical protein